MKITRDEIAAALWEHWYTGPRGGWNGDLLTVERESFLGAADKLKMLIDSRMSVEPDDTYTDDTGKTWYRLKPRDHAFLVKLNEAKVSAALRERDEAQTHINIRSKLWKSLKAVCCADPEKAKRIIVLEKRDLTKALNLMRLPEVREGNVKKTTNERPKRERPSPPRSQMPQ